ncbi:hypothetical protein DDE82_008994 [Stemphylium lycopersici]|nr:hypothetical protein DDE82_008994 [Stemphylium lycopersici]
MAAPNAHSADDISPNARYYTQQQQQQQQTRQWHVPGYQHHPTALAQPSSTTVSPAPIATGATPTSLSIAQAWLQSAMPDLQIAPPHIIPGINPSYYLIQTQGMNILYLPCHAWNVRHLSPQGRHELFIELREFARVMRDNTQASAEYGCAFELVVERSNEVHRKEMIWYACFSDERNGTLAQRQLRYTTIVMNQAQATGIGNFAPGGDGRGDTSTPLTQRTSNTSQSGSSLGSALTIDNDEGPKLLSEATDRVSGPTAPQGKKRPSPYADPEEDSPVAKKTKMDVDDMIQAEVDRMIREGKEAKAKADHQRYLDHQDTIDNYYLEGDKNRKLSDHEWQKLAVWDSRGGSISSTPKPKQSPSRRQGEPYDGDTAKCPLLPSRDLKSYPVKRGDIYMCFHLDSACGGQDTCSEPSHECCRKGLALRELEKKVELKEERACRRIEELAFKDGKLDKRHKTWPNYFSKALRDRDMTRIKAQVQPLGWTQASRDLAETRMSRVARPVPVEPSRRKVQHVGLKQPQPPQAAIQNQRQQVVGLGKGGASSRPLSNAKGKGPAPPVRQTESPSPTGSLSQGKTKTQLSQPRAVASKIPHSHQIPVDVQASQNIPQYGAGISTTAPIMTSTSAVQTLSVQRNIADKSKLTVPVAPKPAKNLGKEITNSLSCRQLCPASTNPYQLADLSTIKPIKPQPLA